MNYQIRFIAICVVVYLSFASCNNKLQEKNTQSIEYTSDYICPMHCEGSGSDTTGNCPVCEMEYVKNTKK